MYVCIYIYIYMCMSDRSNGLMELHYDTMRKRQMTPA